LPAVKNYDCYTIDPSYLLTPHLEAARILATILHPEEFTEMLPAFCAQLLPVEWLGSLDEEVEK
jgi:hypothetical protein